MSDKYPIKIKLKNGTHVTLRLLEKKDEQALIRFFTDLPQESTEFLRDDVRDPVVVKTFIQNLNPERVWSMLALTEKGQIVADATLHMTQHGWRRHVGEVRVVVAPTFHKVGLATSLIHELVNQASIRGLRKLEAQILDSQLGARLAFEHLGFREEGRLKGHAMALDGQLHDLVILTNTVEDLWTKMESMIADMDFGPDGY